MRVQKDRPAPEAFFVAVRDEELATNVNEEHCIYATVHNKERHRHPMWLPKARGEKPDFPRCHESRVEQRACSDLVPLPEELAVWLQRAAFHALELCTDYCGLACELGPRNFLLVPRPLSIQRFTCHRFPQRRHQRRHHGQRGAKRNDGIPWLVRSQSKRWPNWLYTSLYDIENVTSLMYRSYNPTAIQHRRDRTTGNRIQWVSRGCDPRVYVCTF